MRLTVSHSPGLRSVVSLVLVGWFVGTTRVFAEQPTPNLAAGKAAYGQSCARCHGATGHGDGLDAKRFYPRPRDLTLGKYKFRSTASGSPPRDDDLFRTITNGLPGSNMPDWKHLDEATRWQLVYYLKSLSPVFQTKSEPVKVVPDPGLAHVDLVKGRALYEQMGCGACHGSHGRANGSSAAGLVDEWGMKIRPANLTKGWTYRGGSDARSVMLRLLAGIDGSGMPSYAEAISPEDAWQLAYYVTSLQEPPRWNLIAHAAVIESALPTTVDDPRWQAAERTDVRVRNVVTPGGEWASPPTVSSVSFQVLHNDQAVAFRLVWDDPSPTQQGSPDGIALFLRPPGSQGDIVSLQVWPSVGAPPLDVCYWSSERAQMIERVATDYESVTKIKASQGLLQSASHYEDGRWTVMFQRPLQPGDVPFASTITLGEFTPIAFAIWDGSNPEARAVSPWVDVVLHKGPQTRSIREGHQH